MRSADQAPSIKLTTSVPGPRSIALLERNSRVVSSAYGKGAPVVIADGEGASFRDVDSNVFLDLTGGMGCNLLGFAHPKVTEAATRQAGLFSHSDHAVVPQGLFIGLCEALVDMVDIDDAKAALFNSGAEAIENAVKFARAATGRQAVVAFEGSFHGRTLLTLALSSRASHKRGFGPFPSQVFQAPFPFHYSDPASATVAAMAGLERLLATQVDPSDIAAIVIEPIQGDGGVTSGSQEFYAQLSTIARSHGIVLIADEIQTCLRTGSPLASTRMGLAPDIYCLGKAIGGGYPLSAVVGRTAVMDSPHPGSIGGTCNGNAVACAAGLASLEVMETEDLYARATAINSQIVEHWRSVGTEGKCALTIRGTGALVGVQVDVPGSLSGSENTSAALASRTKELSLQHGVTVAGGGLAQNVIRHLPPLVMTDDQLSEALAVVTGALESALHTMPTRSALSTIDR